MGIYDREYVRNERRGGFGGGRPGSVSGWSLNTWIIVVNVVVFGTQALFLGRAGSPVEISRELMVPVPAGVQIVEPDAYFARGQVVSEAVTRQRGTILTRPMTRADTGEVVGETVYSVMDPLQKWGHFSTLRGFFRLEVWRLVTFQFLHADFRHILFNMMGLYFFGPLVEQYLGRKRYGAYYLMCGLSGGLLYLILNLAGTLGLPLPGSLDVNMRTPLVGASAGVFGVLMACAYIAPNTVVQLLFPPIPLKMRTFAYGYVALVAINLFWWRGHNQGGDAAHMGGALAGYFFIRRPHLLRDFFDVFGNSNKPRRVQERASDKELNAILDKVQREGLHSLSEGEKRRLEQATADRRA